MVSDFCLLRNELHAESSTARFPAPGCAARWADADPGVIAGRAQGSP